MYHKLNISPDETLYYRYNPDADILAIRLAPEFGPANEEALPDLPEVTLSRSPESGAPLGLRVAGVQRLILDLIVRDVFGRARAHLGTSGKPRVAERSPATRATPAARATPANATTAVPIAAEPRTVRSDVIEGAGPDDAGPRARRRRGGRRRRGNRSSSDVAAIGGDDHDRGSDGEPGDAGLDENPFEDSSFEDTSLGDSPFDSAPFDSSQHNGPQHDRSQHDRSQPTTPEPAVAWDTAHPPAETWAADVPDVDSSDTTNNGWDGHADVVDFNDADQHPVVDQIDPLSDAQAAVHDVVHDDVRTHAPADESSSTADMWHGEAEWHDAAPATIDETIADETFATETSPDETFADETPPDDAFDGEAFAFDAEDAPEGFQSLEMDPRLGKAIAALGFEKPTPIQIAAVPAGLAGRDVIGLAQTGTGKTLAFVVPGLQRLLRAPDPRHRPRMLVLVPTRELAVQVAQETERLARFTDLRVATIYGGVGMGPQIRALQHGSDVVVATPGRMLDHLRRGNAMLGACEVLVLDEADRMLDMGFLPDVRTLIRFLPAERQTSLFTATMPPEIQSLSMEFQRNPEVIEIARRRPPEQIEQLLYPVGRHLKPALLAHLLKTDPTLTSVLVFTERKVDADILARQLKQSGIPVALMHGDRRQVDRERALQQLRNGQARVLVATNVAARGLDIDDISHVVNYDVPQTVDEYVHRIGRTARAEAEGKAYTFVTLGDETMVSRFEAALGRTLPRITAEGFDYDVPVPNWAKPSAKDVMAMLDRGTTVVDRLRHLGRRR